MEECNFEDVCESSIKNEPEDILSPVEVIVCPENQNGDEDEWVTRCSSERLSTDPLATNPVCEIGNEASMSIIDSSPTTESFATDPLKRNITSESCKSSGREDPPNSMVLSEEIDLGVCQVDDEIGETSQKLELPQPSVNDIINLPPVHADPDPEQTRRLLDNALQKIISQVTKRKGRKRRASQLPNAEIKQQNKCTPEFSSLLSTQQMIDCVLSLPMELVDPKSSIPKTTPVNSRTIPINVRNTPKNCKSSQASSMNNSEVLPCELSQLSPDLDLLPAIYPTPPIFLLDKVPMHGNNLSRPLAKKPRKSAKSFQQRLQSKKKTSQMSTGSLAVLSTNLSPFSVPLISEVSSINGFEKSHFRATGGDPSPAGGSPAATGANAMAEGAQEAGDSRILRTPLVRRFKTTNISKQVSQEARTQIRVDADTIHKDVSINLGEKKQIVAPPSRSARSEKKHKFSRQSNGPTPICNLCGRGFSTYCELMSHMRLHTASVRRFFCSSCKSRFGHAQALVSHVRKRHGIEVLVPSAGGGQRPFAYSCNSCDKFFEWRAELHNHLLDLHGAVRSKAVKGVATALIGMSRMRGAIAKEYSDPVPRSTVLKTSSCFDNESDPLSNSNVNSDEEAELNSNSCYKASHPSSVPSHGREISLSDFPVSRIGTLSPTSIRSCSKSSVTSSTSSSSNKSLSETVLTNFPGYEFNKTREMQRSKKTTSPSHCPVHCKVSSYTNIKSVKNSKYASSKSAQLTSKSSVKKEVFDVNLSGGPKHMHLLKRNSSDFGKGNYSYSQAISNKESKANYPQQVIRDQPNNASKIFDSRDEVPCPVHTSARETVGEIFRISCSKKIIHSKASHVTSSSIRKPFPNSLLCEENVMSPSPPVNGCEFLGSSATSVTSISKSNVSKAVNRSVSFLSNSIDPTCHEISKNRNKKRHSFPPNSSCLTLTNPKLQKIQTTSAGNISLCNTNPARNKMPRPPYVNGNTFVSPSSNTLNRTCHAPSKPTNKKRNSFPPYTTSFTDPKSQNIHTTCVNKSSVNCTILESKNMRRSCSHNSRAVVNVKKIKGLPNFNSSISSAQYSQPNVLSHISQPALNHSNFLGNAKNKVNNTPILHSCGNPIVVLKRIDPLILKNSQ